MDEPVDQSAPDRIYEWSVRLLYAGLLGANLYLLWDSYKDTPAGIELRAKVAYRWHRLKGCSGCAKRREWIRDRAHMLWQAHEIVDAATKDTEGAAGEQG